MKKKMTVIVALLMWAVLAAVIYMKTEDQPMAERIISAVLSGPVVALISGFIALIVGGLLMGSYYVMIKFEGFHTVEADSVNLFNAFFNGVFGVALVALYYFTITNQHIFSRIYGGW